MSLRHPFLLGSLGLGLCTLLACGSTSATTEATGPTAQDSLPSAAASFPQSQGDCRLDVRPVGPEGPQGPWEERRSLPCPGPEGIDILAVGDVGLPGDRLQNSVDAMQRLCAKEGCDLLGIAGDLLYGPGDIAEEAWRGIWDEGLARLGLPGLAVLGNHEYRHEPNPGLKRRAVYGSDGRSGLVLPSPSYVARLRQAGNGAADSEPALMVVAAIDTDSIANPGPEMPGGAGETLTEACALGAPVLVIGHHPPTSQGRHHSHEARVEQALQRLLQAAPERCEIVGFLAGHDHDLQVYPPNCEAADLPAILVSGVVARGFRGPGPQHLSQCRYPASLARTEPGAEAQPGSPYYLAGPSEDGGFIWLRVPLKAPNSPRRAEVFRVTKEGTSSVGTRSW